MNQQQNRLSEVLDETRPANIRRRQWRMFKDGLARYSVSVGGVGVVVAITLIFFYLAYVVVPLFRSAEVTRQADYPVPGEVQERTLYLAMEEQAEIGVRFSQDGSVTFFRTRDGEVLQRHRLPLPEGVQITSHATANPASAVVAFGLSNGTAMVVKHAYRTSFPGDQRLITPVLEFPLGEAPVVVDPEGRALTQLVIQLNEENGMLVAATGDEHVVYAYLTREESMLDDEPGAIEVERVSLPEVRGGIRHLLLNPEQDTLYLVTGDHMAGFYDLRNKETPRLAQWVSLVSSGQEVTAVQLLSGGISLMVGKSDGSISQWFPVRGEGNNHLLTRIREFHSQHAAITRIIPEYSRKGFLAADRQGQVGIYHATAHRTLWVEPVVSGAISQLSVAPRANAMLIENGNGHIQFWRIHNEHPEVSWSSLWGKVWYESYPEPAYIWQSSASTETFEPKFSLTPISFGTLKAAFYAMIFAVPLAVMGAIFTAYFMSPRMRTMVKPTIEIMEALPTVILGFLAGLWLAPFIEDNLPGVFSMFTLFPLGVLGFAYMWSHLPERLRTRVPDGWEAALLMPVLLLVAYLSTVMSPLLEVWLFDGNMRGWLTNEMGIEFDQRNSIVVGIAMGFAVIPTIFSITEDAIFGVPRHLSSGSLALGATPWQTLWRVVLLTASPGIFSAVMIGLGRAVGETMIVLMATGNTPVMDMSMFQGMRTLSANIAVEMPESEVGSTHYRVLFLAGMVLFLFTFVFNTLAELIRQRLRRKYSSL